MERKPTVLATSATLAAALLLAACGGGGDDVLSLKVPAAVAPAPVPASAATATVQLSGCVTDEMFIPRSDVPVRALSSDGRLLGNAHSDARGAFRLQLPAGQDVSLAVDRPDGELIKVASGLQSRALTTCLLDPSA